MLVFNSNCKNENFSAFLNKDYNRLNKINIQINTDTRRQSKDIAVPISIEFLAKYIFLIFFTLI